MYFVETEFSHIFFWPKKKKGKVKVACALLRAGANPDIVSENDGTAREIAERKGRVQVVRAIDRYKCRKSLVDLCIGMHAEDFPVLVVLEIHDALCAISGLHKDEDEYEKDEDEDEDEDDDEDDDEEHLGEEKECRMLDDRHLKESVSWEIAKKVKHYLN